MKFNSTQFQSILVVMIQSKIHFFFPSPDRSATALKWNMANLINEKKSFSNAY